MSEEPTSDLTNPDASARRWGDPVLATTHYDHEMTVAGPGGGRGSLDQKLLSNYHDLTTTGKVNWTGHFRLDRLIGRGGQGEVYLTSYRGTDDFTVPVAMKVFSPERYDGAAAYSAAMRRIANIAARVAVIQHDHLLNVQNFLIRRGIRFMLMEWVDGYDLDYLTSPRRLAFLKDRVSSRRWRYINDVILTEGAKRSRFKAGMAVAIVRECLGSLAALHRQNIVHGDIKPSNIMLKLSGHTKLIDMGSAIDYTDPPMSRDCTPRYAAPEVLEDQGPTPRSDLASLGYVLIELLSGTRIFADTTNYRQLLAAKRELPQWLSRILPSDVTRNELLMSFIRGLIAPDANRRFPNAYDAQHVEGGASAFLRQLVFSNMDTQYDNDARVWLEELRMLENEAGDAGLP